MIEADFLDLLRCPLTSQTLALADAATISRINESQVADSGHNGELPSAASISMTDNITAALIRADGKAAYPIRDGIPVLLPDSVILI